MAETIESREAKSGERMIEVRIRFWTDELAEGEGQIMPKHACLDFRCSADGTQRIARY